VTDPSPPLVSAVPAPAARVALSTASVYPESTATAFELARGLGYDAVEVMVGIDPISQDADAIDHLSGYYEIPVCAVHAPCLLITQRVWGSDPWAKLEQSAAMAGKVGAGTVVVHPPFRWQREYARDFAAGIERLERDTEIAFAVENMYPWRASRHELQAYLPSWNPVEGTYAHVTLDLSHSSTAGSDVLQMAADLGPRLRHVHMTDGSGSARDEHLVPGRGNQPCAELLGRLSANGFAGDVVVEINTRRAPSRAARVGDLAESLAFTRLHLAAPASTFVVSAAGEAERLRTGYGS
jgi:sugar phosphate isomerase/epimerase